MMINTEPIASGNGSSSAGCLVLIVDDSEIDRLTYRRHLESCGTQSCRILDCESAETALQLCAQDCPDVILLDYLLPDSDGIEFLQDLAELLEIPPPVIMLTGQGNEEVAVEAMKQGAKDYLVKGYLTRQKLLNSVALVIAEQKLQAQLSQQHRQRELVSSIALKISCAIDFSEILQFAVNGSRTLLGCDRALVYQLHPDIEGTIVAESVASEYSAALGNAILDSCLQGEQSAQIDKYLKGYKTVIANIETADLADCHVQMLRQFQVKAVLAVPILFRVPPATEQRVWGLLIAHHCKAVHEWTVDELNLLDELSMQMAISIQQADLVFELQQTLAKQQIIEQQLRDRVIEIEQTNGRLSKATRLLTARNQELDEFSCVASHDLQAPLRGIANLAEWLVKDLGGQLPPENQQQLELIQSRVLQMNGLINGLLLYARVGKENIDSASINISQLLMEVIEMLVVPIGFQVNFAPDLPTIVTQSLLLKQVLANLIGNAIKYHDRENGQIEIVVQVQDTFLQFKIIDDGPGIVLENQEKIFGIFQTLLGRDDLKGTGIGLAIVKKIVESQGGLVSVESEQGKGSVFLFTWPITP
jgi:signal transduction histidine kinase/FixJ family two-component response regulator